MSKKDLIGGMLLALSTAAWGTGVGQGQLQGQGQAQSLRNVGNVRNDVRLNNNVRNVARAGAGGAGGNADNRNANTVSSTNSYLAPRNVASAYAPTILPTAVCMGSTAAGAAGATFGVSIGSSWTDANCILLEQVRVTAAVLGDEETAKEMLCAVPAYREARLRLGKPCATLPPGETVATRVSDQQYTDPLIRRRLNLPPLQ